VVKSIRTVHTLAIQSQHLFEVVMYFMSRKPKRRLPSKTIIIRSIETIFAFALSCSVISSAATQTLFGSTRLTPPGEYTKQIEGPAVDAAGTLYVPNFQRDGTIGKVSPGSSHSELFTKLPVGSIVSGTRFDLSGRMYLADWKGHNVFVIEPGQTNPQVYFHAGTFHQPNDLAVAADGTLYASDPIFGKGTGQIWRIARGPDGKANGAVMSGERPKMGVTNGIDLSPDDGTLYVSESPTREIWAYRIEQGKLTVPRLVKRFDGPPGPELDGLRTDADGAIFVARPGSGTVAMLTPDGNLVREIPLKGKTPSNLTFGGPDGKTIYVTQVDGGFIETFRVERAGREFCMRTGNAAC
jgi:streptogramin lyase